MLRQIFVLLFIFDHCQEFCLQIEIPNSEIGEKFGLIKFRSFIHKNGYCAKRSSTIKSVFIMLSRKSKLATFRLSIHSNLSFDSFSFQTFEQWENDGCDNCEPFLNFKNNRDNVYDCTSSNFDGLIASCKPDDSWVCKWQRISKFKQGVYAVSVSGRLPQSVIRDMTRSGIPYRSRDTSKR